MHAEQAGLSLPKGVALTVEHKDERLTEANEQRFLGISCGDLKAATMQCQGCRRLFCRHILPRCKESLQALSDSVNTKEKDDKLALP